MNIYHDDPFYGDYIETSKCYGTFDKTGITSLCYKYPLTGNVFNIVNGRIWIFNNKESIPFKALKLDVDNNVFYVDGFGYNF